MFDAMRMKRCFWDANKWDFEALLDNLPATPECQIFRDVAKIDPVEAFSFFTNNKNITLLQLGRCLVLGRAADAYHRMDNAARGRMRKKHYDRLTARALEANKEGVWGSWLKLLRNLQWVSFLVLGPMPPSQTLRFLLYPFTSS
ncbi:hypothetical protein HK104_005527 [Borealophlyctis nickersoniae]|nr:hypothetical protein HK104_005527 [Borealophlyctis nickersoniae]